MHGVSDVNKLSVEYLSVGFAISALLWAATYRKNPGIRADFLRLLITVTLTSGLAGMIGESPVVIVFWWILVHGNAFEVSMVILGIAFSWLIYAAWFFSTRELMRKLCTA